MDIQKTEKRFCRCAVIVMQREDSVKLLFFLPTFTFGGAERTSLNLLNGITRDKYRICLITSKNIFPYFEHLQPEKFIPLEELGTASWFGSFGSFLRDVKKTALLLKREKPDLAFGMMHYPSSLLVFAKKLNGLPVKVIASPRGPSTEYLRHFEKNFFRKAYLKRIFKYFCRNADKLVVASGGMKEECIRDYSADPLKIAVIPNSVDIEDIRKRYDEPTGVEIPPGYLVLSSSGRLEKEKNMSLLLNAFAAARMQTKMKLIIIGGGTERENLAALAQRLNIQGDVIFTGHQNNPFKFIKKSDIYVHTCLFEGFANSIIEALACGVAVISIDCPYGPRDIISNGENGFLVPMNDEQALVKAILTTAGSHELRTVMVEKGHERADDFSVKKMADGYEKVFGELI
jgi:glycosyltransferase involved in cell wall biosynthesis